MCYLLLSLETMAVHCFYNHDDYPGRNRDAHIQAARGCYEALQEIGVPARIKHIHDFEWEKDFSAPQLLILPNISALTEEQIDRLESFVKSGNTVLATGLTGMFGKYTELLPSFDEYPLVNLFGGVIKDMRFIDECFEFVLDEPSVSLPSHLFQGEIKNATAHVIATNGDWVIAVRNRCGDGEAIWIPSMICLGAWL
jgi:beta-galactosidase